MGRLTRTVRRDFAPITAIGVGTVALKYLAGDADVQAAVHELGLEYVIELDYGHAEIDTARMFTYGDGKEWVGIDGIRDGTPGFETVLSRDDMRLYRIVG